MQYKETINLNENDDSRYYPDFRDEAYQDYWWSSVKIYNKIS